MNPSNHKPLNRESIQEVAEKLMTDNLQTTTLEVKNQLRKDGYYAEQNEVSRWMLQLATWQNWTMANQGNHRVYRFRNDSNDTLTNYLEKDNAFWEVKVSGMEVVTGFGKIGEDGILNSEFFKTNRQAMHHGRRLLNEILAKGYVESTDKRPSLDLRKAYGEYYKMTPLKCKLGYFNVKVADKIRATLRVDNQQIEGYLIQIKSAGFEFEWALPEKGNTLKNILNKENWDALEFAPSHTILTGEKIIETKFFTLDNQPVEDAEIIKKSDLYEAIYIKMNNDNLYNIRFDFTNDKVLNLSKFQLDLKREMLPLTLRFFNPKIAC
jgi:predicted DNA-binding WGR domain protein